MEDMFRPSGEYIRHQTEIPKYLKKYGVNEFRNSSKRVVRGYGMADIDPIDTLDEQDSMGKIDAVVRICKKNKLMRRVFERIAYLHLGMSIKKKLINNYLFCKYFSIACNAKPIEQLSDSMVGNPKNVYKINNKNYTFSLLKYYAHYAETCKIVDYSKISTILEIGSGFGMQQEIFKKLYPNMTIFLTDLPSHLLFQKEYLSKIFLNKVELFGETNDNSNKIILVKPENLKDVEFDVFWNSISFQVMDIDVAKNYLKIINKQTKKFICLKNKIDDNDKSILSKSDYIQLLSNFDLVHFGKSEAQAFSKDKEIFNMIFKRNTNG